MDRLLVVAAVIAAASLAACGDKETVRTVTAEATSAPLGDIPILIETRVVDVKHHKTEVQETSVMAEAPFCPGGTATGGSEGATITSTFHCPDGTLKVQYAPTQRSFVQGAPWTIVSGTGKYEGLKGGGSMVAAFKEDDPEDGREVFTGIVGE